MRDDQINGALATAIQAEVGLPEVPATALARRLADVLTPVVRAIVTDAVLSERHKEVNGMDPDA